MFVAPLTWVPRFSNWTKKRFHGYMILLQELNDVMVTAGGSEIYKLIHTHYTNAYLVTALLLQEKLSNVL